MHNYDRIKDHQIYIKQKFKHSKINKLRLDKYNKLNINIKKQNKTIESNHKFCTLLN